MKTIPEYIFGSFLLVALINEMTTKFILGLITGVYISTKYDLKPYVQSVETTIVEKFKETKEAEETDNSWINLLKEKTSIIIKRIND